MEQFTEGRVWPTNRMPPSVLFYISGHGYGHARRMTQVISELNQLAPDVRVHIRTAAPPRVFEPLPADWIAPCDIDTGLAEKDPFTIDRDASLHRLMAFMTTRRKSILAGELTAVRQLKPTLIVTDIPFLACDVAAEAGVPCLGISNFTWDWIYENLFDGDSGYAPLGEVIADSYARMSALLELPFGQTCPAIRQKAPIPLIALLGKRQPADILVALGIASDDSRPRVLIGTRGTLDPATLSAAAADGPEFLFLCPPESSPLPANAVAVRLSPGLDFSDVLKISDVVVSKLGYGMISECICSQTRLLWPPRTGFAEDRLVAADAPRYARMLPMPMADYQSGRWGDYLRQLMTVPTPTERMKTTGGLICAATIADLCRR